MMFLVIAALGAYAKSKKLSKAIQPSTRNIFYGFEDCSEAPSSSRKYTGCGVTIAAFACADSNTGIDLCMEKCNEKEECRFVSTVYDAGIGSCSCSMRTLESLISSATVSGDAEELSTIDRRFCNEDMINNEEAERVPNCERVYGCIYKLPDVYTTAKDSSDWSFVDACKSKTPRIVQRPSVATKEKVTAPVIKLKGVEMVQGGKMVKANNNPTRDPKSKVVKVSVPKENVRVKTH